MKCLRLAYAKASVSIDHRGIVTTSHHPSLMQQKHWYPGSVKRFKPHLFDLKRHRIERYFVSQQAASSVSRSKPYTTPGIRNDENEKKISSPSEPRPVP